LVSHWQRCISQPQVRDALEAVYLSVRDAIEARAPACWASGRCCNFRQAGHLLFVTGLETAYLWKRLDFPLTTDALLSAYARGDCPFLARNLCSVHTIKPLGCRVYFCDQSAQDWQMQLSERSMEMIKRIHVDFGIEYRYGEWRQMLGQFITG
jgi:hypothetical protein